ncbi:phospholipase A2 inhibitor and Ly6/PLAUR domain-containing protein-like [Anolis sagrei]|uniref:phospholipase A2 inhibitor and Ly6/PLAUR domain-containing protein-like n=1 Tax=Anolis sagrei TaxID=38937 RepID=UPI00352178EB
MHSLLRLLLFFVILRIDNANYVPLECEVCEASGTTCTGPKHKCPIRKDTCAISLSESTLDGKTVVNIEKGCENSNICRTPSIEIYLGPNKFYRANVVCCTGDKCQNATPKLPPKPTKGNGKHCLACYTWEPTCHREMVDCLGNDKYCFEMESRTYTGANGTHLDRIIKGCTTKSVCGLLAAGRSPVWSSYVTLKNAECKPKHSKGFHSISSSLTSIFWLLLLKIFLSV